MSEDRIDIVSPTGNSLAKLLDKRHQTRRQVQMCAKESRAASSQGVLDRSLLFEEPQGLRPSMQNANSEKAEIPLLLHH